MLRLPNSGALVALCLFFTASAPAQTEFCLPTLPSFDGRLPGDAMVFFDIEVRRPISLRAVEGIVSRSQGSLLDGFLSITPQTYVGKERQRALWSFGANFRQVFSAGPLSVGRVPLDPPIALAVGRYGIALRNGWGLCSVATPFNRVVDDGTLRISSGAQQWQDFTSEPTPDRVWNGRLCYSALDVLIPEFDASPRSGSAPLAVVFQDRSISTSPGGLTQWHWDFENDGIVDSNQRHPIHVYGAEGTYDVRLRVYDLVNGAMDLVKPGFVRVDWPEAEFTWERDLGGFVRFRDRSRGSPTSWEWDFGDDGTIDSTQREPAAHFPEPSTPRVALRVSDALGSDRIVRMIDVGALPVPDFARTFSAALAVRGFWFTAPQRFSISGLRVPDERGALLQNAAIYRLAAVPPDFPLTASGGLELFVSGVPSSSVVPVALSFEAGERIGVLGACGNASIQHSSYGVGGTPFSSALFGARVELRRFLAQDSLVLSGGALAYSQEPGRELARIVLETTSATAWSYGLGTASGSGSAAPALRTAALPVLGRRAALEVDFAEGVLASQLWLGIGRANVALPFGSLLVDTSLAFAALSMNGASSAGPHRQHLQIDVPADPGLQGFGPLNWQSLAIVGAPLGSVALSNGLEWFLGL
jgi:PKD repeat protein